MTRLLGPNKERNGSRQPVAACKLFVRCTMAHSRQQLLHVVAWTNSSLQIVSSSALHSLAVEMVLAENTSAASPCILCPDSREILPCCNCALQGRNSSKSGSDWSDKVNDHAELPIGEPYRVSWPTSIHQKCSEARFDRSSCTTGLNK